MLRVALMFQTAGRVRYQALLFTIDANSLTMLTKGFKRESDQALCSTYTPRPYTRRMGLSKISQLIDCGLFGFWVMVGHNIPLGCQSLRLSHKLGVQSSSCPGSLTRS